MCTLSNRNRGALLKCLISKGRNNYKYCDKNIKIGVRGLLQDLGDPDFPPPPLVRMRIICIWESLSSMVGMILAWYYMAWLLHGFYGQWG